MRWGLFIWLIPLVISCRKPYNPTAITTPGSYLVIEGVIKNGSDSTFIKLSRTVKLAAENTINPETNATVTVEGNDNSSYPLTEIKSGIYAIPALNLNTAYMYRLKVIAANNSIYQSDFAPLRNSPAIDSISYKIQGNGVQIYANSHDQGNNTRYYRWEYNETWLFHVPYESYFILKKTPQDTIISRPLSRLVYQCWLSDTTSTIVLGSSAKLSQDVISGQPLTFVSSSSEKFENLYSIQVKQFALTADAYNYWQQLKKNTQQLGSIFDAEPSELASNIHCITNPSEPVIGYISAGTVVKTRIFIDNRKLPAWSPVTPYNGCSIHSDAFFNNMTHEKEVADDIYGGFSIPVQAIQPPGSPILGYTASTAFCADCTTRGTNIKPNFWP